MEAYWLAFAGFFFGLTYGLLQICTEVPILRREHQSGVSNTAYLASKVALLAPVLLVVNAVMLGVLRILDRLPDLGTRTWVVAVRHPGVNAVVALFLGLLASAAVTSVAQAALALPMLCFPAVLFSGAMVPVPVMTRPARASRRRCPTAGPSRRSPAPRVTRLRPPTRRTPTSATRRPASTGRSCGHGAVLAAAPTSSCVAAPADGTMAVPRKACPTADRVGIPRCAISRLREATHWARRFAPDRRLVRGFRLDVRHGHHGLGGSGSDAAVPLCQKSVVHWWVPAAALSRSAPSTVFAKSDLMTKSSMAMSLGARTLRW